MSDWLVVGWILAGAFIGGSVTAAALYAWGVHDVAVRAIALFVGSFVTGQVGGELALRRGGRLFQ